MIAQFDAESFCIILLISRLLLTWPKLLGSVEQAGVLFFGGSL